MDSSFKNDFKILVGSETIREKYRLIQLIYIIWSNNWFNSKYRYDESQIYLSTFIASFGYCNKLTAFDMVYAVEALLENNVN